MLPKLGHETESVGAVTNPDPATHEAIMVNVTTQRPHSDTTTILNAGDHPFVVKQSVIFYADGASWTRACSMLPCSAEPAPDTLAFRRR